MWELGAGEVALVVTRCPASGLLGVGAWRAHAPNKAPGPYAWGAISNFVEYVLPAVPIIVFNDFLQVGTKIAPHL